MADPEMCYFNTYIKKYPLIYTSFAGEGEYPISLKDCIVTLMMDNLVRLTFREDPEPGQTRSQQICTLPITIRGIPRDWKETEKWHDTTICDGTLNCPCKATVQLTKEDISKCLITLTEEEETEWSRFSRLIRCGWNKMWSEAVTQFRSIWLMCRHQEIQDAEEPLSLLDESMHSLRIDDSVYQEEHVLNDSTADHNHSKQNGENWCNDEILPEDSEEVQDEDQQCAEFHALRPNTFSFEDLGLEKLDLSDIESDEHSKSEESLVTKDTMIPEEELGFIRKDPPPMLTRHPPPATGRDDDIRKLAEILDDVAQKLGRSHDQSKERILLGPDHKIGQNVLKLMKQSRKYAAFLPEFPVL